MWLLASLQLPRKIKLKKIKMRKIKLGQRNESGVLEMLHIVPKTQGVKLRRRSFLCATAGSTCVCVPGASDVARILSRSAENHPSFFGCGCLREKSSAIWAPLPFHLASIDLIALARWVLALHSASTGYGDALSLTLVPLGSTVTVSCFQQQNAARTAASVHAETQNVYS